MKNVKLSEALGPGADFKSSDLSSCEARDANLSKANMKDLYLTGANFEGANLEGSDLSGTMAQRTNFSQCRMARANLEGAVLDGADFSCADLTDANFSYASLYGTIFEGANLNRANFRYAWGLSEEMKKSIGQQGARTSHISDKTKKGIRWVISRPLIVAFFIAFLIGLGIYICIYFTNINHLSISKLQIKLKNAKQNQQLDKALILDEVLIRKFKEIGSQTGIFNRSLDIARIYRILNEKEKSIEMLKDFQEIYKGDVEKEARILVELARAHKKFGNSSLAISLLEGVDRTDLKRELLFLIDMTLANFYRNNERTQEAIEIYKKLAEKFSDDSERCSQALRNLAKAYNKRGRNHLIE